MPSLAHAIEIYIRAKDENRPHLLSKAFAEKATVHMIVGTEAISFPPVMSGLRSIADVLVRQFGRNYENVYTVCLSAPPDPGRNRFSCLWMVGMSGKQDGAVRVGGGLYDWHMSDDGIEKLKIEIAAMRTLEPSAIAPLMNWLSELPYPWCPVDREIRSAPKIEDVSIVLEQVIRLSPDSI